jgi:hypothetical protein
MNALIQWLFVSALLATSACSSTAVIDPVQQGGPLGGSAVSTTDMEANQVRRPLSKAEAIAVAEKLIVDRHHGGPTWDADASIWEVESKAWGTLHHDPVWWVIFRFAERNFQMPFWHEAPDGGFEHVPNTTSETLGQVVTVHAYTGKAWFPHSMGDLANFERVPREDAGR